MKKIIVSLATALATTTAFAGGLNTNTNANAAYLRFFAQDANITLTSLYANPAGSAFLSKGWHFGIHDQIASQQRNITTGVYYNLAGQNRPLLQFNPNYGTETHEYQGKAFSPLIPSMDFSYNSGKKWSINAHIGVVGGGGSCEYLDGLGTFDALYAGQLFAVGFTEAVTNAAGVIMSDPTQMAKIKNQVKNNYINQGITPTTEQVQTGVAETVKAIATENAVNGNYRASNDGYMKGTNMMIGFQVGATYKITDNLAVYGGIRAIYATGNYNGYVQDAKYSTDGGNTYKYYQNADGRDNVLSMNCDQTGFGIAPILGVHWTINKHWNVAAKYEFKTRVRMKNTTRMNEYTKQLASNGPTSIVLGQFVDGAKVADDIPGYLAVGTQYSPIENVRIGLGYHWIQETSAEKYNNKQNLIDNDTHEIVASVEWRCHKYITVSGGWQKTMYGVSDAGMNDISFNCSNNSMGLGVRIHPSKLFNIDLGYMHTFYQDRTVNSTNWMGQGLDRTDVYSRKNDVVGIGLNFAW